MKKVITWCLVILGTYVATAPIWPSIIAFQKVEEWEVAMPSIDLYSLLDDFQTKRKGSNLVLTGHRFSYTSPYVTTLYNLDKMGVGDSIWIKDMEYSVVDIFEVEEDQTWVESESRVPIITVYTCTPIWNPRLRLVVRGELVRII